MSVNLQCRIRQQHTAWFVRTLKRNKSYHCSWTFQRSWTIEPFPSIKGSLYIANQDKLRTPIFIPDNKGVIGFHSEHRETTHPMLCIRSLCFHAHSKHRDQLKWTLARRCYKYFIFHSWQGMPKFALFPGTFLVCAIRRVSRGPSTLFSKSWHIVFATGVVFRYATSWNWADYP